MAFEIARFVIFLVVLATTHELCTAVRSAATHGAAARAPVPDAAWIATMTRRRNIRAPLKALYSELPLMSELVTEPAEGQEEHTPAKICEILEK